MKLDFNFKLKDFDGKEIEGTEANKLLSNVLASLNRGNSMKLYDWALRLWRGEVLEMDDTDGMVLKELINASESLTVISKVPMLKVIEKELTPKD